MQQIKKVVLAYSGGVDTSVCIPYLQNEFGISEVVTFVADLGQGEDLELIRQKALNSGASKSIVGNLVNSFVERYAFPAIRANALYLDKYPLSTALARPCLLYTSPSPRDKRQSRMPSSASLGALMHLSLIHI